MRGLQPLQVLFLIALFTPMLSLQWALAASIKLEARQEGATCMSFCTFTVSHGEAEVFLVDV
jgi:hypothetical protein